MVKRTKKRTRKRVSRKKSCSPGYYKNSVTKRCKMNKTYWKRKRLSNMAKKKRSNVKVIKLKHRKRSGSLKIPEWNDDTGMFEFDD